MSTENDREVLNTIFSPLLPNQCLLSGTVDTKSNGSEDLLEGKDLALCRAMVSSQKMYRKNKFTKPFIFINFLLQIPLMLPEKRR